MNHTKQRFGRLGRTCFEGERHTRWIEFSRCTVANELAQVKEVLLIGGAFDEPDRMHLATKSWGVSVGRRDMVNPSGIQLFLGVPCPVLPSVVDV